MRNAIAYLALGVACFILIFNPSLPWIDDGHGPVIKDVTGLHVMFVEEVNQRATYTKGQMDAMHANDDTSIRKWVESKGEGRFFVVDQNDPTTEPKTPWVKAALTLERKSLPWLIVTNGKAGYSGPAPAEESETRTLIKKFDK